MTKDQRYMRLALEEAYKYKGQTHPNPAVGALIVKDDKIISIGAHQKAGTDHAEIVALKNAKESVKDATMYVTLEPCSFHGKTPPCCPAIISSGIKRVVIGSVDPNPKVSGKGIEWLKSSGVEVEVGVLKEECDKLNEDFFVYITKKRPFITLKCAMSLDGKLAKGNGESKWISSQKAREISHVYRKHSSAILVGINTILKDNPELTVRLEGNTYQPYSIVIDPNLDIPYDANIFKKGYEKIILITSISINNEKKNYLESLGVMLLRLENFDIKSILKALYEIDIMHVFVEGGAYTISRFLEENAWDKMVIFRGYKFIGKGISLDFEGDFSKTYKGNIQKVDDTTDLLEIYNGYISF
ncbi:bifunctional diaminohydroxyphosphoribosylaminopyrimidine deaminase/5-amino-6-(5-phosphoribosylamino)uracil reductase RibD [Hydrogenobaculum acidophilum]